MFEIFQELVFLCKCKFILICFQELYCLIGSIMGLTFKNSRGDRLFFIVVINKFYRFHVILISLMKDSFMFLQEIFLEAGFKVLS